MAKSQPLTTKQQYWLDHISQARSAGMSLSSYAEQENLSLKALYNYQTILRRKGLIEQDSRFIRLSPNQASTPPAGNTLVRITLLNGVCVDMPVNESDLASLLRQVSTL